jgi:hypothetical protein
MDKIVSTQSTLLQAFRIGNPTSIRKRSTNPIVHRLFHPRNILQSTRFVLELLRRLLDCKMWQIQQPNRVLPSGTCDCGCGGGPNVPQRVYKHPKTTFHATPYESKIVFRTRENVCGIQARDVLEHSFGSLLGANDPVLPNSGTSISLRFEVRSFVHSVIVVILF